MEKLAKVISWIFLPMLMPIYALALAMFIPNTEWDGYNDDNLFVIIPFFKYRILLLFLIFTAIFPAMLIYHLKKNNTIKSIEMDDKLDRKIPINLTAIFCFVLFAMLWYQTRGSILPFYIYALPLIGAICILIVGVITRWYKISLHALGAGFLGGFLFFYSYLNNMFQYDFILWIALLLGGIIMSARMYLNKHSLSQVLTGYALGFSTMSIGLLLGSLYFE
jgi:membrane-associated phospholipid phosphatase